VTTSLLFFACTGRQQGWRKKGQPFSEHMGLFPHPSPPRNPWVNSGGVRISVHKKKNVRSVRSAYPGAATTNLLSLFSPIDDIRRTGSKKKQYIHMWTKRDKTTHPDLFLSLSVMTVTCIGRPGFPLAILRITNYLTLPSICGKGLLHLKQPPPHTREKRTPVKIERSRRTRSRDAYQSRSAFPPFPFISL
jgi:hypothetical protein